MKFDIHTLALLLSLANWLHAFLLFLQYRANKNQPGVGWWMVGGILLASGLMLNFLRDAPGLVVVATLGNNALSLSGSICLYIGVLRFLARRENRWMLALLFVTTMLLLSFFTLVQDDLAARRIVISAALSLTNLLTSVSLLAYRGAEIRTTARFLSAVFLSISLFFALRAWLMFVDPAPAVVTGFTPIPTQVLTYLIPFIGSTLWTFGFIMLINQRLNAENREATDNLELMFNTAPEAVVISRLHDGQLVTVNEGFCALSGFTRAEILGKTSLELGLWKHEADRQQMAAMLKTQGHCANQEGVFRRKDGSEFTGILSAKLLTLQGIPHIISVTYDISVRKQAEEALHQANLHLAAADRAKQSFLANISHELNAPLHGILSNLQLLTLESNQENAYLEGAYASATHLHALVNAILDLVRLEQGQYRLHEAPLNLPDLLAQTLRIVERRAEEKSLQLTLLPPPCGILEIIADGLCLRQVLLNLLNNAINYTAQGWVKLEVAAHPLDKDHARLEFSISDSGVGIAPADQARILRPFERGATQGESGAGLGLSIVTQLLRQMDSTLRIDSALGQGSRFSFVLEVRVLHHAEACPATDTPEVPPLATLQVLWQDVQLGRFPALADALPDLMPMHTPFARQVKTLVNAADKIRLLYWLRQHWPVGIDVPTLAHFSADQDHPPRVLVIDDEVFNVQLVALYLREFEFDLLSAAQGEDGIRLAKATQPQLILLDIYMPGMNGFEVCRSLKTLLPQTPVIFFTASQRPEDLAEAFASGATDYLSKPVREEELLIRLTTHLQRSALYDGQIKRLQKHHERNDDDEPAETDAYVVMRMYQIREILLSDLSQTPSLDALATLAGLNRNKINDEFKVLFGNPPHVWQREQRLHIARDLLHSSDTDISQIATRTGYTSAAAFTRAFKQHFGITPSVCRTQGRA